MNTLALPPVAAPLRRPHLLGDFTIAILALLCASPMLLLAARVPAHPALAVLLAGAITAATATILMRPEWGSLALLLVGFWNFSDIITEQTGFSWVLRSILALTLIGLLLRDLTNARRRPWRWPFALALLFYGAAQIATFASTGFPRLVTASLWEYGKDLVMIYLVVNLLRTPRLLRLGVDALLAAAALLALPPVIQRLTGSHFEFWGLGKMEWAETAPGVMGYRPGGALGDPNFLALVLVAVLPLAVIVLLEKGPLLRRLLAGASVALCLAAAIFTYSRAALIGLVFAALMLLWHPRRKLITGVEIAGVLVVLAILPSNYWQRMLTLTQLKHVSNVSSIQDQSFRGRENEVLTALLMFRHHPITGVGAGGFSANYERYSAMLGTDIRNEVRDPHSLYTQVLSETGLLGAAAFLFLLWTVLYASRRARHRFAHLGADSLSRLTWGLELSMLTYLLLSVFLHAAFFRHFLMLLALAGCAVLLSKRLAHLAQTVSGPDQFRPDEPGVGEVLPHSAAPATGAA